MCMVRDKRTKPMLCGVNMRNKKVSWFRFILRRRLVRRWGLVGVACVVRRGTGIVASVVSGRVGVKIGVDR